MPLLPASWPVCWRPSGGQVRGKLPLAGEAQHRDRWLTPRECSTPLPHPCRGGCTGSSVGNELRGGGAEGQRPSICEEQCPLTTAGPP